MLSCFSLSKTVLQRTRWFINLCISNSLQNGFLELHTFFKRLETSLVVQWLKLCTPNVGGASLIADQGIKISHPSRCGQLKKKKNFQCPVPNCLLRMVPDYALYIAEWMCIGSDHWQTCEFVECIKVTRCRSSLLVAI